MNNNPDLAVLGLWHLGLVSAIGFSDLGLKVIGYDEDQQKISLLKKGRPPIYEPFLTELLQKNLKRKTLSFTNSLESIKKCSVVMIAQDTPLNEQDEIDLLPLFSLTRKLAYLLKDKTLVIVSSQVPVGTTEKIESMLQKKKKEIKVAYVPENLRLGKAVERFLKPSMIVIGTGDKTTFNKVCLLYRKIRTKKIFTDIKTAEMVKHAINSFLATSISFANELSNLSEAVGADFLTVAKIIKKDERIGEGARILPGLGFAGGTLARDLKILWHLGRKEKQPTYLISAVFKINSRQKKWVVNKLNNLFNNNLSGKKIGILGLTYTPNTSTLRRSLSVETIEILLKQNAQVVAFDPQASRREILANKKIVLKSSGEELARGTDALVLMTEWRDFLDLPWQKIKTVMKQPLIIDAKNFLTDLNLEQYGFKYFGVGRG